MKQAIVIENVSDLQNMIKEAVKYVLDERDSKINSEKEVKHEYLDVVSLSKRLGLKPQTIYQNIRKIPHYKMFGKLYFKPSEIQEYIESKPSKKL